MKKYNNGNSLKNIKKIQNFHYDIWTSYMGGQRVESPLNWVGQ